MIVAKVIHILCVMGWFTAIFAVPRALIYWKRESEDDNATVGIGELTFRLYRFSAMLAVIALITGLYMGMILHFPQWLVIKLGAVGLLALHFGYTGVLVARARRGEFRESEFFLRMWNESSVVLAVAILYLVVRKSV